MGVCALDPLETAGAAVFTLQPGPWDAGERGAA